MPKTKLLKFLTILDRFEPIQIGAEQDKGLHGEQDGIPYLRFDPAAAELFLEWRINLEKRLRSDLHPAFSYPAFQLPHLCPYRSR